MDIIAVNKVIKILECLVSSQIKSLVYRTPTYEAREMKRVKLFLCRHIYYKDIQYPEIKSYNDVTTNKKNYARKLQAKNRGHDGLLLTCRIEIPINNNTEE